MSFEIRFLRDGIDDMRKERFDKKAELILKNGQFWTADPDQPAAEALAVHKGRILEVGSWDQIQSFTGKETQLIDLEGAFVVPGFIDSHTHFLEGGLSLSSINLRNVKSREEFVTKIKDEAQKLGKGKWITDGEWDHQQFDSKQLPKKEWIDGVTPENPVCVNRKDMHMALANSLALKIAGVTKHTSNPEGGEIAKNPGTGEPTGILTDAAVDLVLKKIPEPGHEDKVKAAKKAVKFAHKKGVTSVHEMGPISNLEIYEELYKRRELDLRICLYPPISLIDHWPASQIKRKERKNFYKVGGLKGFVDGSLGSSTALFFEPYTDNANHQGLLVSDMFPEGKMEERIQKADKEGLQVAVHAIGDKANHIILNIFEKVMKSGQKRDRRWRIEHAQHLIPEDIVRMGELEILASVQPYHLIDDGQWAEKRIGSSRLGYSYPYRSLLENKAKLAFGSDWTVAPLDPILGIFSAVTRSTLDGKNPQGWVPKEKISVQEAVEGYTSTAAFAEFSENIKGSLKKGKFADMVVLDKNLLKIDPFEIKDTQILLTLFDGRIVYKK
ncbi:MAG: amidohydrolase [Acidobacteriota bacterium]